MERLIKYTLARPYFQIGVIFYAETKNNITVKNPHGTPVGIIAVHLCIELR